jgi:hypothetical protein
MKVGEYTWDDYVKAVVSLLATFEVRRFAEVGVLQGKLAWSLLDVWEFDRYYMVDPWRLYPGHPNVTEEQWDKMATQIYLRAAKYPAVRVIRLPSTQAQWLFEWGSLDAVYIDGDHRYLSVKADVEAWLPRLRAGGVLFGHDYESFPSQVGLCIDDLFGGAFGYISPGDIWHITKEVAKECLGA